MPSSRCPDQATLSDYLAGRLDPPAAASVCAHLAICEACSRRLAEHSGPIDKTIEFERNAPTRSQHDEESSLDDILRLNFLQPSPDPRALGRVGSNDVLAVLGRGAMGIVLKAFDTSLCRHVAIKVLAPALAASAKAHERFKREARAAASINHPNVVIVHAVDEQAGLPYMVMEYVSGVTLRQRIRAGQRFDLTAVLRIGAQVASGLAAAHQHGVIHRDIKPSNIMLEDGIERVKITDFGLALVLMDASKITSVGLVVGTPAYMSPEQIDGALLDPRSDLFSLGCVFHAIITGQSPFAAMHPIEVARRVREYDPPPLSRDYPEVPTWFSDLVCRLLQKRPEDRPASAEEVARVLTAQLAAANLGNQGSLSFAPIRRREKRRPRRWWAAAGALTMLLLALVAAWRLWPDTTGPQLGGVLTVGANGRFRSLHDALQKAGPGSTIRLLDDATYQGPVLLDDGERYRDVTIESPRGATIENASSKDPVISVLGTPGVCLRGLRLRARNLQHAVSVRGKCEGLTIDGVQASVPEESPYAAVVCWAGTTGSRERPITLSRCDIRCGEIGFVVDGAPQAPSSWITVDSCRFHGPGFFVVLEVAVHDVCITRNVFLKGAGGIGFNMKAARSFRGIRVANNSFFETGLWLNFKGSSLDQQDFRVERNLLVRSGRTKCDHDLAAVGWFRDNWCEPPPGADLDHLKKVVELRQLQLLSRDPASRDFLRPMPGTMTVPAGEKQLPYIGALPPAEAARD